MAAVHPTRPQRAGWREWVALPALGVSHVKAKLDTGARSSALHVFGIEEFTRDGADWVRFSVHPWQRSTADAVIAEHPIHDRRRIRSSSGHMQERIVIRTPLTMLGLEVLADVTLASRDEMGFRMLVGREALRQGFMVDAARSYRGGRPSREVRRRNRGRVSA